MNTISIDMCLEITTKIVLAAIQSGKFDAQDGESVASYFGTIYAQVCDCAGLTAPEFVDKYGHRKLDELTSRI